MSLIALRLDGHNFSRPEFYLVHLALPEENNLNLDLRQQQTEKLTFSA